MAYRGDDGGVAIEAQTADGVLRLEVGPRDLRLAVGARALVLGEKHATVLDETKKRKAKPTSYERAGKLFVARGVPREDLGVWLALVEDGELAGIRRIFGAAAMDTFAEGALHALSRLDAVSARLRIAVSELGGWAGRGVEIGAGHPLDKVLLADHETHYEVYARGLFRDRARFVMAIHRDGRVVVPEKKKPAKEVIVRSRFAVTVWGDYIRFADTKGTDRARVAIPWLAPEDRHELARRIAQLVDDTA